MLITLKIKIKIKKCGNKENQLLLKKITNNVRQIQKFEGEKILRIRPSEVINLRISLNC